MEKDDRIGKGGRLEERSVPRTNQAGKKAGACDEHDQENGSGGEAKRQDELEEHSLPGTNQAGKGPGSSTNNDPEGTDAGESRRP